MSENSFKTIGTTFVEDILTAKNSDELFKILKDTCCITLKPEAVADSIKHLDLPSAAIDFKATVARLQIMKRSKVINDKLAQMKNKEEMRAYLKRYLKQEREIPQVANYTYIAMQTYMKKGFGKAEDFKRELHEYLVKPVSEKQKQDMEIAPQVMQQQRPISRPSVYGG